MPSARKRLYAHQRGTQMQLSGCQRDMLTPREPMSARAGEIARESGAYKCCACSHQVNVIDGCPIPDCANCGEGAFHTGTRTVQNQPASMERVLAEAFQ